jgi:hypothetical protein
MCIVHVFTGIVDEFCASVSKCSVDLCCLLFTSTMLDETKFRGAQKKEMKTPHRGRQSSYMARCIVLARGKTRSSALGTRLQLDGDPDVQGEGVAQLRIDTPFISSRPRV